MAQEIVIKTTIQTDSAQKSVKNLNDELNKNLQTIKDLEEQQQLYNEALKQVDKGSASYKQIKDQLGKIDGELKNMGGKKMSFLDSFSELPGVLGTVGQSVKGLQGGLSLLAKHPIVAIITILVGLLMKAFQAFKSTQEGTELLNQGMAALDAIISPVMDALTDLVTLLVEGLVQAFKFVASAIEDVLVMFGLVEKTPDGMETRVEKAMRLTKEYDKLVEKQKELAVEEAKSMTQIEALKRIRDDESKGIEARIAANEEVAKIQNDIFQQEIKNQELIVKNMQERMAMSKTTIEETEALREAEIKLQEFKQKGIGIEVEQATNRVGLIKEELGILKTRNDNAITLATAQGKSEDILFEKKRSSITQQIALLRQRNATELAEYKDLLIQLKIADTERQKELTERSKVATDDISQIRIKAISDNVVRETAALNEDLRIFEDNLRKKGKLTDEEEQLIREKKAETSRIIADIEARREEEKKFAVANTALIQAEIDKINIESAQKQALADLDARHKASIEDVKGFKNKKALQEQYEKDKKTIILDNQANINAGLKAAELEIVNLDEQRLLSTAQTEEEKTRIITEATKKRLEIEKKYTADVQAEATKTNNTWQEAINEFLSKWGAAIQFAMQTITQALGVVSDIQAENNARAQDDINQRYASEEESLKASLANREMSENEYNAKLSTIQQAKESEELELKKKAFNQGKAMQTANAVMSTAQAVISAFASGSSMGPAGIVMGPLMAGIAAAMGAVQVGVIQRQQFRAAQGGVVPGGKSKVDSVSALLAPGEAVINSESTSMFPNLLSEINKAGGGKSLAPEMPGKTGSSNSSNNGKHNIVKAVVVEHEMTDSQRRIDRIERSVSFG